MKPFNIKLIWFVGAIVLLSFKSNNFSYRKISNNSFKTGESIEFRVHYGFVTAGYGTIRVLPFTEKINGRDVYHVIGKGKSASSFDWFFKVRDEYNTFIDVDALAPVKYSKEQHEGGYNDNDNATFDHEKKSVNSSKGTFTMPEYTQDIISMLYYARSLNVQNSAVGTIFPITFILIGTSQQLI